MEISIEVIERMATIGNKSGLFGVKTAEQAAALMLIAQAEGGAHEAHLRIHREVGRAGGQRLAEQHRNILASQLAGQAQHHRRLTAEGFAGADQQRDGHGLLAGVSGSAPI